MAEFVRRYNELAIEKAWFRTHSEVSHFFDGLELIEPGVVKLPDSEIEAKHPTAAWGGMARKS
jgi:S-adenosyl methyltransferase